MKKLITLLLAVAMVFMVCACGQTAAPAATDEPDAEATADPNAGEPVAEFTTVTPGKLTVATSPDFAPYEFYAIYEAGNPVLSGFDVALAQYIADYLNLELEIIPMDFDGVLAELANGTVDIGLAGLSPDPKRMDAMDFSDIYYMGGQSFVTTVANKDLFTSLEDANKAEYSIGAQTASIQYNLALEHTPDADVVMLTKVTDIIAELLGGKLDGAFIETAVAECYAINYPDLSIVLDVPYDTAGSAVGISKGNEALVAAVNEAVAAAVADGSLDQFVTDANELAAGSVYEGLLEDYDS